MEIGIDTQIFIVAIFFGIIFVGTLHVANGIRDKYAILLPCLVIVAFMFYIGKIIVEHKYNEKINSKEQEAISILRKYIDKNIGCDDCAIDSEIVDELVLLNSKECISFFRLKESCFENENILNLYKTKKQVKDEIELRAKLRKHLQEKLDLDSDSIKAIEMKMTLNEIKEYFEKLNKEKQKEIKKEQLKKQEKIDKIYKELTGKG